MNSDVDLHLRAHNGLRNKTITVVIKIITVGAAAGRSRERGETYNTDDNSAPNDGSACACLASLFGGMPPSFLSSLVPELRLDSSPFVAAASAGLPFDLKFLFAFHILISPSPTLPRLLLRRG